jgi:hypothetical protein
MALQYLVQMHISKAVYHQLLLLLPSIVHVALTFNTSVKVNAVGSLTITVASAKQLVTSSVTLKV